MTKKKNFLRRIVLLASLSIVFTTTIFAHTGTIKGIIIDSKNQEPLIGATVIIEGNNNGAAADLNGNFILKDIPVGTYTLATSYVGYTSLTKTNVVVEAGKETEIEFLLSTDDVFLETVIVSARTNRESENILMMEQRQMLVATQAVGARELSRKGIGDAQAAVAQVSGISRQEGVKNVFVRGLGDRYNTTLLNGFPIPSEEPEFRNISLDFFGTDIIKNIGVSKVFSASDYSDIGGAIINISSKELIGKSALGLDISGGVNTAVVATTGFLRQDGSNYFGFANTQQPTDNQFNFPNSLDPSVVSLPLNHGFGISGGKSFEVGDSNQPLSFFVVATHSIDYSFTEETIRNANTAGTIWQDQKGDKYSQNTSQLVLANAMYNMNRRHNLQYNFMLVHANHQYVGDYFGYNAERHQDSPHYIGFSRRQQTNDNMLLSNQLLSDWELSEKWKVDVGVAYNLITGLLEPDRRENYFSQQDENSYILTGSNRQKRFFSALTEDDINVKTALTYKLNNRSDNNLLKIGYVGQFSDTEFESIEYNFSAVSGLFDINTVKLDDLYNQANLDNNRFRMTTGDPNTYHVARYIHSAFAEASHQFGKLTGNVGLRMDNVDMTVDYRVQHVAPGKENINKTYFLPSLNLKYDVNNEHAIRFGASKTYTLPQSKEISPYQYVNISFASQGNPNIKPSDTYNVDLKWDYYISSGELFSLTGFYKYIQNPIGRVDEGNSAGLLTYNNISHKACVGGVEMEFRKNIFNRFNADSEQMNRLSVGLNASYIYTHLTLDIRNTEARKSGLEGASPFLANADMSYIFAKGDKNLVTTLVLNYFSDRIHTIGAGGFNDIIEKGTVALNFVASYHFNKHISANIKATNLLNPSYRLTRETSSGKTITLNEYKKGQNISLGISYAF